jgi:hypothetical protein
MQPHGKKTEKPGISKVMEQVLGYIKVWTLEKHGL